MRKRPANFQPPIPLSKIARRYVYNSSSSESSFSIKLLKELTTGQCTSQFCSPFSVSVCLALLYAGANGTTKEQIRKIIFGNTDAPEEIIHQYFDRLVQNSGFRFANMVCVKEGDKPNEDFMKLAAENYDNVLEWFSLENRARLVQKMNEWAYEESRFLNTEIITEKDFTPLTKLILLNVVHFDHTWIDEFDQRKAQDMDFRISVLKSREARMMRRKAYYHCMRTDHLKVLRLPYQGHKLAMYVFLPIFLTDHGSLFNGVKEGELMNIMVAVRHAEPVKVDVAFPCMDIECSYQLDEILQKMGVVDAFNQDDADFKGIIPNGQLHINQIVQKADIKTNEKGCAAANATRVPMSRSRRYPKRNEFIADHPFFYFIVYEPEMAILFGGTYT